MTPPMSGTMREQLEQLRPGIRTVPVFGQDMSLEEREKAIEFLEKNREDDVSHEAVVSEDAREVMGMLEANGGRHVTLIASDGSARIEAWYDGSVAKFFMRFSGRDEVRSYQPKRFGVFLDNRLGASFKIDMQMVDEAEGLPLDPIRNKKSFPLKQTAVDDAESRSNSGGWGAIAAESGTEMMKAIKRKKEIPLPSGESVAPKTMDIADTERVVASDPFVEFYERMKKSPTFKKSPHLIDQLIASIKGVREGKMSLKDLKNEFGKHHGFYSDVEKLLVAETEAKESAMVAVEKVSDVGEKIESVPVDEPVKVDELTDDSVEAVVTVKQSVSGEEIEKGKTDKEDELSIERPSLKEKIFGSDWDERKQKESDEALEELRRKVSEARRDYAAMDYKKTGMLDSVKRFFPFMKDLSKDKDVEILAMKNAYQSAVTEYKNARLNELEGAHLSQVELRQELVGVLKEIELDEQLNLYDARIEAKLPNWMADGSRKAVDWYRGLSFKERLLLSGALVASGAVAGVSFGASAASAWFMARRAFGGAVAGRGVFQFAETLSRNAFQGKTEEKILDVRKDLIREDDADEMLRMVQGRLNFSIEHSDERLNEMMKHRTRNTVAGFATGIFLGSGAPNLLVEKFRSFGVEPFEGVGDRVKEGVSTLMERARETGGAAYESASDFLHKYASFNEAAPVVPSQNIVEAAVKTSVAQEIATQAASDMHVRTFESVVGRGSSVIGSLSKLDDLSAAPKAMWDRFVEANKDNPFFVKEKFTMPGAQVMVEDDEIVEIVDKQGVLLGTIRDLSEGHSSVWRAMKDMTLDQMRTDRPELYRKTIESIAKYQNFLGDDMPSLNPDQSMKTWVAGITKAYFKKKGW